MEMDPQARMNHCATGGAGPVLQHQQQQQPLPVPPEKPALEEKASKGEEADPWNNFDAQAAFLGPTLWDKRLPYDGQDFKLEYVDLEEFLTENGIPVEQQQHAHGSHAANGSTNSSSGGSSSGSTSGMTPGEQMSGGECSPPPRNGGHHPQHHPQQLQAPPHLVGQYGPGPSVRNNQGHNNHNGHMMNHSLNNPQNLMRGPTSFQQSEESRSPSPCGSSISHSSDESTSTMHPHHPHNGNSLRRLVSVGNGVTVSISEFGLASFPGHDFDPRTRIFTEDELKPQPMIKKSKKQFVPDDQKDAKYWARRRKNNMAAKRSRDARRVKENQIAMRACFLEKENSLLKQEVDRVQKENMMLKEQLSCCRHDQ